MSAVWYRLRIEMRRGWRGLVALGVFLGVVGGVVLALAAGAERTETSYQRFLVAQRGYDVLVPLHSSALADERNAVGTIRRLPGVAKVARTGSFFVIGLGAGVGVIVPPDDRVGTSLNRFKMLAGRRPDPKHPTEVTISFTLADQYHLRIGDTIPVLYPALLGDPPPDVSPDEAASLIAARSRILALVPGNRMRVVGIEASPGEFPPQIEGTGRYLIHASPALYPVKDELAGFSDAADLAFVRLRSGARGADAFLAALARRGTTEGVVVQRDSAAGVDRSVHTQAVALRIHAVLTALAGALILGQLLAQSMTIAERDASVLAALGMRRRDRFLMGVGRAAAIGILGAVVAVATAVLASPFFPTGLAGTAEPDPGVRLDAPVLVLGALGIAVGVVLLAAWPAWRAARVTGEYESTAERTSVVTRLLRNRRPIPLVSGVRMALEPGRGRAAIAGRSSIVAVALGIATLVAALTFGASLSHLLDTPALYGQSWTASLTTYDASLPTQGLPILRADRRVAAIAVGRTVRLQLDGHRVDALALDAVKGRIGPKVLEGRAPRTAREIALGTRTLDTLHVRIGDRVDAGTIGDAHARTTMRVVGRVVFPLFSERGRLGDGAAMTRAGWERAQGRRLLPAEESLLVRLRPGATVPRVVADLEHRFGGDGSFGVAITSQGRPTDVVNFGRVESTPYVLGAVLAAVSVATLTYLLVSAVRRRRRDLAVLKTLGFVRGQVRRTVASQATTVVAVALLVGVPVGILAGRWLWDRFATDLGIVAVPVVPVLAIVVTGVAAVVAANLVAAGPARRAARTSSARLLRAE